MNFNDLESAWKNDTGNGGNIPNSVHQLKQANMPLDKIRKNLRHEFWFQLIAIIGMGFLPKIHAFIPVLVTWFYVVYVIFVSICVYYLVKLFLFYKRIGNFTSGTKEGLYEMYYDIRLNIELYKTFTFSVMPFALIFMGMFIINDNQTKFIEMVQTGIFPESVIAQLIGGFAAAMVLIGFLTEYWVQFFYGKYAKEIRKLLDKLKEE